MGTSHRLLNRVVVIFGAAVSLALCAPARADLQNITNLFNTGVDNSGVPLTDNAFDLHYVYATPPPTGTVPIVTTSATGFPVSPSGPWLPDNSLSAWITPSLDTTGNAGDYVYRTTFTLPANINPSQAFVAGRWSSDNAGVDIRINGQSTGITGPGDFTVFTPQWVVQRGLVNGTNTLDFVVNEATGAAGNGGFTGLRVQMVGRYTAPGRVTIPGLKNSGVAVAGGTPLPEDTVDPGVVLAPGGLVTGPAFVTTSVGGFPIPPWTPDNAYSAWLSPTADTNVPDGDYLYQTTFNLTGLKPETVEIYGRWAVDNGGTDILLNGVPTGNFNGGGFGDWTDFTLSTATGETFLSGVNTLTFVVHNDPPPGPSGVRFEFLSATAEQVPEPSGLALVALAAAALCRRRPA